MMRTPLVPAGCSEPWRRRSPAKASRQTLRSFTNPPLKLHGSGWHGPEMMAILWETCDLTPYTHMQCSFCGKGCIMHMLSAEKGCHKHIGLDKHKITTPQTSTCNSSLTHHHDHNKKQSNTQKRKNTATMTARTKATTVPHKSDHSHASS